MHKNFFQTSDFILYINILLSFILEYIFPTSLHILDGYVFGILIIITSWLIIIFSKIEFKKYQQKSGPNNSIDTIIDTGIYAHTRNPIYLGVLIVNIGLAFVFDSVWMLGDTLIVGLMINHFLIKKEDVSLKEKFGEGYERYVRRVRKWL